MSFLYIEDGIIYPTKEGFEIPQVKAVYNSDKTEGKVFFRDVLKYIFFVYNLAGVYKNTFEGYKRKMVIERHLSKRKIEDFEGNQRVKDLIKEYLDCQMSKNEKLLYKLELDMERLLERISEIPYKKTVKARVPYTDEKGDTTNVTATIEIDNSKEKADALLLADKMISYGDKLKAKIKRDHIDNKKASGQTRLFDTSKKE